MGGRQGELGPSMPDPYKGGRILGVRGLAPTWCVEFGASSCWRARFDQRRAWGSGGWWTWVVALRNVVGVDGEDSLNPREDWVDEVL